MLILSYRKGRSTRNLLCFLTRRVSFPAWHTQNCQNNHSLSGVALKQLITFPDFFIFFILPVLFAFILLCEFHSFPFYNFNLRWRRAQTDFLFALPLWRNKHSCSWKTVLTFSTMAEYTQSTFVNSTVVTVITHFIVTVYITDPGHLYTLQYRHITGSLLTCIIKRL